jgi:hypothetical protein
MACRSSDGSGSRARRRRVAMAPPRSARWKTRGPRRRRTRSRTPRRSVQVPISPSMTSIPGGIAASARTGMAGPLSGYGGLIACPLAHAREGRKPSGHWVSRRRGPEQRPGVALGGEQVVITDLSGRITRKITPIEPLRIGVSEVRSTRDTPMAGGVVSTSSRPHGTTTCTISASNFFASHHALLPRKFIAGKASACLRGSRGCLMALRAWGSVSDCSAFPMVFRQ